MSIRSLGYLRIEATDMAAWRDAVDFAWGPEQMPYGQYEFGIEDPNGYFLAFAEAAKHEP